VSDAALPVVRQSATQFLFADLFVRHSLDDVRPSDEHIATVPHHDHEIRNGWRVDRSTGAGPHDGLRFEGRRPTPEYFGERCLHIRPGHYAFLNACAARVVQADDRRAHLHGEIHDLADFLCIGLGERAAEDSEVLSEDINQPALNASVTGDDTVAGHLLLLHPEVLAAMRHELVEVPQTNRRRAGTQSAPGQSACQQIAAGLVVPRPSCLGLSVEVAESLQWILSRPSFAILSPVVQTPVRLESCGFFVVRFQ
jgi:hypothetical protein